MVILTLSACNFLEYQVGNIKEELKGREMLIQTYDEDSQLIDQVRANSISISPDKQFGVKDSEGNTISKSSVLNITVGGHQMVHVGSSMIAYETGLKDLFSEYTQTVNLENFDKSVPFVNRMVNDLKNLTTGASKVILVRSQTGKPLATFVGNDVSYYSTDVDKSTGLLIDGHYLLIYRCDYTIYDMALLQ